MKISWMDPSLANFFIIFYKGMFLAFLPVILGIIAFVTPGVLAILGRYFKELFQQKLEDLRRNQHKDLWKNPETKQLWITKIAVDPRIDLTKEYVQEKLLKILSSDLPPTDHELFLVRSQSVGDSNQSILEDEKKTNQDNPNRKKRKRRKRGHRRNISTKTLQN